MSEWHFMIAAWLAVGFSSSAFPQPSNACAVADQLLDLGLLEDAKKEYVTLLADPANRSCVLGGLRKIANFEDVNKRDEVAKLIEDGQRLMSLGLYEQSKTALDAALKLSPSNSSAIQKLVALNRRIIATKRSRISALSKLGLHDEAEKELKLFLKAHPQSFIPDSFQYLSGGGIEFWNTFQRNIRSLWRPAGEIIVVSMLLILLAWRLFARYLLPASLSIEEFDNGDVKENNGSSLAAMMQSAFHGFSQDGPRSTSTIQGPIEALDLPTTIQEAIPSNIPLAKALPALVSKILPRRVRTLSGQMHHSREKGIGVTLILAGRKQLTSVTIWQDTFDSKAAISNPDHTLVTQQLAETGAIWLLYMLSRGFGRFESLRYARKFRRLKNKLGTNSWKSYAAFRAGLSAENHASAELAQKLYIQAIKHDRRLIAARINLALLIRRRDKESELPFQILRRALVDLSDTEIDDNTGLPLDNHHVVNMKPKGMHDHQAYYAAVYSLIVITFDDDRHSDHDALAYARSLRAAIKSRQSELQSKLRCWRHNTALSNYLAWIEPIVTSVQICVEAQTEHLDQATEMMQGLSKISSATPLLRYNMACAYSMLAKYDANNRSKYLDESISHLNAAVQLDPKSLNTRKADYDRTLAFVRWRRKSKFTEALEHRAKPELVIPLSPLSALSSIDPKNARKLQEEGISSEDDLLRATITRKQRAKLAKKIGVGENTVKRWADAMDLSRIVGVGLGEVNLLFSAQVYCISDLAAFTVAQLQHTFRSWIDLDQQADLPSSDVLNEWIDDALNMKAKVI